MCSHPTLNVSFPRPFPLASAMSRLPDGRDLWRRCITGDPVDDVTIRVVPDDESLVGQPMADLVYLWMILAEQPAKFRVGHAGRAGSECLQHVVGDRHGATTALTPIPARSAAMAASRSARNMAGSFSSQ